VGGFGYALIMLLVLTNLAVLVYLNRGAGKKNGLSRWHGLEAPLAAPIGFAVVLVLATKNIHLLITKAQWTIALTMTVLYGSIVVGSVYARVLRRTKPHVYTRIGRQ
jgi:hypothetical protein